MSCQQRRHCLGGWWVTVGRHTPDSGDTPDSGHMPDTQAPDMASDQEAPLFLLLLSTLGMRRTWGAPQRRPGQGCRGRSLCPARAGPSGLWLLRRGGPGVTRRAGVTPGPVPLCPLRGPLPRPPQRNQKPAQAPLHAGSRLRLGARPEAPA